MVRKITELKEVTGTVAKPEISTSILVLGLNYTFSLYHYR